jgi:hypothetical protein
MRNPAGIPIDTIKVLTPGVKLPIPNTRAAKRTTMGTASPPKAHPFKNPMGINHMASTPRANIILGLPRVGVIPHIKAQARARIISIDSIIEIIAVPG